MFKVVKKDGSMQDFDFGKITKGVAMAGGSEKEAEEVAREVEIWLTVAAPEGTIKSEELHMKVIEVLKNINPEIGKKFEDYKKPVEQ